MGGIEGTLLAATAMGAVIDWIRTLGLEQEVVKGVVSTWCQKGLEAAASRGWSRFTQRFRRGRLAENHHISVASRTALGEALDWMAVQLAHAPPVDLQADMFRAVDAHGPHAAALDYRLPDDQEAWVNGLRRLAADPGAMGRLDAAAADDVTIRQLLSSQTPTAAADALHQRVRAFLQAELADAGQAPDRLEDFFGPGWPLTGDGARLTLYQAWSWCFRDHMKRGGAAFNAFVAGALADLLERDALTPPLAVPDPASPEPDFARAFGERLDRQLAELDGQLAKLDSQMAEQLTLSRRIELLGLRIDERTRRAHVLTLDIQNKVSRTDASTLGIQATVSQINASIQAFMGAGASGQPPAPATPADERAFPKFVGLRAYRRKDADDFFGREREIIEFLQHLAQPVNQTLLIKGKSGVGKSSLMMAGVLPRLPGRTGSKVRNYLFMAPGNNPFLELCRAVNQRTTSTDRQPEAALAKRADELASRPGAAVRLLESEIASQERRVLYVDQLEELLIDSSTDAQDSTAATQRRTAFVQMLARFLDHDRERNVLVATLREDYLSGSADAGLRSELLRLFERGPTCELQPPDHDSLIDRIVTGPCDRAGFAVDERLLAALRLDVRQMQGGWPPLLSACLEEMVSELQRRSADRPVDRRLDLGMYQAIGGLRHIVTRRARAVESSLAPDDQARLPDLFEHLVRIDQTTGRPTKDRIPLSRPPLGLQSLIDQLLRQRLLVDEPAYELVHDALFDSWPALRAWLDRNKEQLFDRDDFASRARIWQLMGRPTRKLAREDDYANKFREMRPGAVAALKQEGRVSDWLNASQNEELFKHIANASEPDVWRLPILLRQGIQLTDEQVDGLKLVPRAFYFALSEQALKRWWDRRPGDDSARMSAQFGQQQPSQAGDPLAFFTAEMLGYRISTSAQYQLHHYAALGGHVAALRRLASLGADLGEPSGHGRSAVDMAATGGQLEALRHLLDEVADPGASVAHSAHNGRHSLHAATMLGHVEVVTLLLDRAGPTVDLDTRDEEGWSVLGMAAHRGDRATMELLLDSGRFDPKGAGPDGTPLACLAASEGHFELAEDLMTRIDESAEALNQRGQNGWSVAASLIYRHADQAGTAQAVQCERMMAQLLHRGLDAKATWGSQYMPLLVLAADRGSAPMVTLLLKAGADPLARDASDDNAMDAALINGHSAAAMALLAALATHKDQPIDEAMGSRWMRQVVASGLYDVAEQFTEVFSPQQWQRWMPAPTQLDLMGEVMKPEKARERGRVIDLLRQLGAHAPTRAQFVRDAAGRVIGAELGPIVVAEGPAATWPRRQLLHAEWHRPDPAELTGFRQQLAKHKVLSPGESERLTVREAQVQDLPWYPGGLLLALSIADAQGPGGVLLALRVAGQWHRLLGQSPVIHQANKHHLDLANLELASRYLAFFCAVVHGGDGPFTVLTDPSQLVWADDAPKALRDQAEARIQPCVTIDAPKGQEPAEPSEARYFNCTIQYGRRLFLARMKVQRSGSVEMLSDELLLENLPIWSECIRGGLLQPVAPPPWREPEPAAGDGSDG
nr:ankyrin repeat domain-containing protein [Comamonas thiooxydans]